MQMMQAASAPRGVPTDGRVADRVYDELRDKIFDGEIEAGERLSVPALAEQLGVSRTPVREAVQRLTQDGLVTESPRRGAVVAQVGTRELVALYEVREVLEGLAARLAVEQSGQRVVRALGEILARHEKAVQENDLEAHIELDMQFHSLIRRAGKNADVIRLLDEIEAKVRLAMHSTSVPTGLRPALADHKAIWNAIKSGDPLKAENAARNHIARLRGLLEQSLPSSDRSLEPA